jgi:hypothetical protein
VRRENEVKKKVAGCMRHGFVSSTPSGLVSSFAEATHGSCRGLRSVAASRLLCAEFRYWKLAGRKIRWHDVGVKSCDIHHIFNLRRSNPGSIYTSDPEPAFASKLRRSERTQPTAQAVGRLGEGRGSPEGAKEKNVEHPPPRCDPHESSRDFHPRPTIHPHQIDKLPSFSNSPLRFSSFIWYKQFTESRCVASRAFLQLSSLVRHLNVLEGADFLKEAALDSSRPRDYDSEVDSQRNTSF